MSLSYTRLADAMASGMGFGSTSAQVTAFARGVIETIKETGVAAVGSPIGKISGIDASAMATKISGYGGYGSVSSKLVAFCASVKSHIETSGIVTYADSPVFATNGIISGLSGAGLANLIKSSSGYPSVTSQLAAESSAIVAEIMANGKCNMGVIS